MELIYYFVIKRLWEIGEWYKKEIWLKNVKIKDWNGRGTIKENQGFRGKKR